VNRCASDAQPGGFVMKTKSNTRQAVQTH